MTIQKIGFTAGWLTTVFVELLMALGLAWITVSPTGRVENSLTVWFCAALLLALILHLTVTRFAEAVRIRNASIRTRPASIWAMISGIGEFLGLLNTVVIAVIALTAAIWLGPRFQEEWARGELRVSAPTFAYGAGYLAYWCVLVPVYHLLKGKFAFGAGFRCTLAEDRLIFALGDHAFDMEITEITELRVLASYAEGAAFFPEKHSAKCSRNRPESDRDNKVVGKEDQSS